MDDGTLNNWESTLHRMREKSLKNVLLMREKSLKNVHRMREKSLKAQDQGRGIHQMVRMGVVFEELETGSQSR